MPCLLALDSSLCHLLPGHNVSRSCTEEGWSQLEPGSYYIACGLDDNASSLDEVRESCAFGHHLPQAHIPEACPLAPTVGYTLDLHRDHTQGGLSSEQPKLKQNPYAGLPLYIRYPSTWEAGAKRS